MNMKKERIMAFELDIENLPPLRKKEQEELNALAQKDDASIDFSDIPPIQNLGSRH